MRVVLKRDVTINRYAVFAEIAWLQERPELQALCHTALKEGRLSAKVVQGLLPSISDAGSQNVVAYCESLGLCDPEGGPTHLTERASEDGLVPVPEQGVYEIWLSDDPMLRGRMLHAERLQNSVDGRHALNLQASSFRSLERDRDFASIASPAERIVFRRFPHRANNAAIGMVLDSRTKLRLEWSIDFQQGTQSWRLVGDVSRDKKKSVHVETSPESTSLDLDQLEVTWGRELLGRYGHWHEQERFLGVALAEISDGEVRSMTKAVTLRQATVPGFGAFRGAQLVDIPLGPLGYQEAERWAVKRLMQRQKSHPGYRTHQQLLEQFDAEVEGTTLAMFEPGLPGHDALVQQVERELGRSGYWHLTASSDLAPYGGSRLAGTSSGDAVVSISLGEHKSMQWLVSELLGPVKPRRLMLIDRYVRDKRHYTALGLFLEALREAYPDVQMDVVTEKHGDNLTRIAEMTGRQPKGFKRVFKKKQTPHDRYVVVDDRNGNVRCWTLTNSPLDARPNGAGATLRAPLEWRDITATKLEVEQMFPKAIQWIEGGEL